MKVGVQSSVCVGSGQCYGIAPNVFGSARDGRAVVLVDEPDESEQDAVIEASEYCPSGAIELSPEPT
jgi:ferredoxin